MDKIQNKKIIREMSKNLILEKNCFCNLRKSQKKCFFWNHVCTYEAHSKKKFLPKFPLFLSFFTNFFCYLPLNYEILIFLCHLIIKKIFSTWTTDLEKIAVFAYIRHISNTISKIKWCVFCTNTLNTYKLFYSTLY